MASLWTDLTPAERAVLANIANRFDDEWSAWTFAGLTRLTTLDRDAVRDACRALRAKGLARHERALMTEDGEFVGAGYTATPEGSRLFFAQEEASADA